jgi:hypothetical protein
LPAPTISHVILTGALIILVFAVQFSYVYVVQNMWAEMVRRELKELTDYVSDTLSNLYLLVNSTSLDTTLKKTINLPSRVSGSSYKLEIVTFGSSAQSVKAYVEVKTWVNATSWLPPGLKVNSMIQANQVIQSIGGTAQAGCTRFSKNVFVGLTQ